MPQISVIICSHNPRPDYLERTLNGLRCQTLPKSEWELLIVDSASTKSLADEWDFSWHPHGRHVREDSKGKMTAILRGIDEACGALLIFVDDDNVLEAEYLKCALAIAGRHSYLSVFGAGKIDPEFEVAPPSELASRDFLLALRDVPAAIWSNNIEDFRAYPWGAGMGVTREVADLYRRLVGKLNVNAIIGPQADRLFRGDDDLFSWAAVLSGQGFGVFPELQITHLISANRLRVSHLLRLIHDRAFSHGILTCLLGVAQPRQMDVSKYLRLLPHGIKNGSFSARCQWAELQGEASAARFTAKNRLCPVDLGDLTSEGCVEQRQPQLSRLLRR